MSPAERLLLLGIAAMNLGVSIAAVLLLDPACFDGGSDELDASRETMAPCGNEDWHEEIQSLHN